MLFWLLVVYGGMTLFIFFLGIIVNLQANQLTLSGTGVLLLIAFSWPRFVLDRFLK